MAPNWTALAQAVQDASQRYTRLVLVVGPKGSGKTKLLIEFSQNFSSTYHPVGAPVAERLLGTPARFRDTEADKVLKEICKGPGPHLLDNLELLFDPQLRVDPYRLLGGLARTKTIVAAWPGTYEQGTLTHATPGHREYQSHKPDDAICIKL